MKIIFIINNSEAVYLQYVNTGFIKAGYRRAVEIELTEEQVKKLGICKIGHDYNGDVYETIESISLSEDYREAELLSSEKPENDDPF